MKTTVIVAVVFVVLILLLIPSRKSPLTINHFKRTLYPVETFAITNNRMTCCYFFLSALYVLQGTNIYADIAVQHKLITLKPHAGMLYTMKNSALSDGHRLSMKVSVRWELTGLRAAIMRLKLMQQKRMPYGNPFNNTVVFSDSIEVSSEEFVELTEPSGQAQSNR